MRFFIDWGTIVHRALLIAGLPSIFGVPATAETLAASPWTLSLGSWYGHDLKESDSGSGDKTSNLTGPELGVRHDPLGRSYLYAQAAYGHDIRNAFNKGIVNGGVGVGVRF